VECIFLFDAQTSALNGEPNDGGRPRQDPETGTAWWNDSALKRFFRDALIQTREGQSGWRVQVQHGYPLNRSQTEAFEALGIDVKDAVHADDDGAEKTRKGPKKKRLTPEEQLAARGWIAKNFVDVRWFGGLLDTGYQIGNLTGPLQFQIATSVHPITVMESAVTRVTVTTEKDLANVKDREMGTKFVVPYAMFRDTWSYTPARGEKTGFSVEDMDVFLDIFRDMFSSRSSAGLGLVTLRKAWIFVHEGARGNIQSGELVDRVTVTPDTDTPRSFRDFTVRFDDAGLAEKGVSVFTEETLKDLVDELAKNPGAKG
jgi:CRISPR-associated protein Csd2